MQGKQDERIARGTVRTSCHTSFSILEPGALEGVAEVAIDDVSGALALDEVPGVECRWRLRAADVGDGKETGDSEFKHSDVTCSAVASIVADVAGAVEVKSTS